ncbi:beta-ketoacyl-ACP synthase 3 [Bacteroidales bacterium OttesenSCG-928-K03]|nr:beta-ketoacyl-ACP synthase 3 [Bacteroidales bacterium OttesenSCG-928-L14]MDL2243075.1 beta-ketoacyl-ACP synthase 3 [Bacteroidales bacterium OttesenSCG-928-K03]
MKIIGTGSAVPKLVVTNDMLAEFLDTSDEWITTRTGIKERRLLSTEDLTELSAKASLKAIEDAGISVSDIDFLICSNVANNYVTPGLSCVIQGEIGAKCPTLDINAACTGFIYAMDIAESYFRAKEEINNILIICAEEPSRYTNWQERDTCILFADAAAAVVVTRGDNLKATHLTTTCKVEPLYYQRALEPTPFNQKPEGNAPLVMNGRDVYKLAISSSVSDIKNVLKKAGITADDVDKFVLHQANIRIIETIRIKLNQPEEKFPHNIEHYGNTSSATIPLLLDELKRDGKLKKGETLVFSAFGAGFTTGACVIVW